MNWRKVQLFVLERLVWFIAIVGYAIFIFLSPVLFFNISNIDFVVRTSAAVGVLAIAEGICLLSGSMDLSLPAISGLVAVFVLVFGQVWFPGVPPILLLPLFLIVGVGLGTLNGLLINRTGVHPFLVTLGTSIVFEGLRKVISQKTITVESYLVLFPGGGNIIGGYSFSTVLVLVTVFLAWLFLNYTVSGLRIYAVGGNAVSAKLMGVNVKNMRLLVHTLAGIIAGFGGLLFVGHVGATSPEMMDEYIFIVFAMAVFGGIALQGGRGAIEDIIASIFFIGTVDVGLVLLGIEPHLRTAVMGIFIIMGVIANSIRIEMRDRLLMPS
jgi:ribose/xylose/arabinose/galactoside ABC-type transport system permease subunit